MVEQRALHADQDGLRVTLYILGALPSTGPEAVD